LPQKLKQKSIVTTHSGFQGFKYPSLDVNALYKFKTT
jgi:hypothetical protein